MAPLIQISQIQLRRGIQADLPGSSGATFGLNVAEPAFTIDSNRLFIGPDPGVSYLVDAIHQAQTGGFPWGNVEVLTEFSPTNQSIFNTAASNITSAFIGSLPLSITGPSAWATLNIQQVISFGQVPSAVPFLINAQGQNGDFGTAKISYYVIDYNTGIPLKTGRLTIFYQGTPFSPMLIDDGVCNPFAGTTGSSSDPDVLYGTIQFQAVPVSAGISIQYQINMTGTGLPNPVMYFRVEQPFVLSNAPVTPASNTITTTAFNIDNAAIYPNATIYQNTINNYFSNGISNTTVVPGSYNFATLNVNSFGQLTYAANGIIGTSTGLSNTVVSGNSIVFSISNTPVTPGTYTLSTVIVNAQGQIVGASNGSAAVANVSIQTSTGLTNTVSNGTYTIGIANSGVTPGVYSLATITVNLEGQITAASNGVGGGSVANVVTSTGLSNTSAGGTYTISISNTTVSPGTYSFATVVVNAQGQITNATSGNSNAVYWPLPIVTTTYTTSGAISTSDIVALVNSVTSVSMTLGSGTYNGQPLIVKRFNVGSVTLTATIDGTASYSLLMNSDTIFESATLIWNTPNNTWLLI